MTGSTRSRRVHRRAGPDRRRGHRRRRGEDRHARDRGRSSARSERRWTCSTTADRDRPRDGLRVRRGPARRRGPPAIVNELLPRATVITPNVPEARVPRARRRGRPRSSLQGAARARPHDSRRDRRPPRRIIDVFFDGTTIHDIAGERRPDGAAHGSAAPTRAPSPPSGARRHTARSRTSTPRPSLEAVGTGCATSATARARRRAGPVVRQLTDANPRIRLAWPHHLT